ncbi:MAG TPA: hypothetical protein VKV77_08095 [Methylovirgula sp.]|nr:hypothetical protein [Methylovirgula sp.]
MRSAILALIFCFAMTGASEAAGKPGGCLKYGAAGAVAGHVAGHHGVRGAVVGCALGMWRRHEYNKEMREHAKEMKEHPENQAEPQNQGESQH